MTTGIRSFFASALLLLSLQSLAQKNYYLATPANGGDDGNAGTSLALPFATIAKALLVAIVPGDTIFVRSGIYAVSATVRISKPGTAARHLVLTVYKPDMRDANSRPIFDFSSMAASSSNRGFQLSGADYWDIYGIVFKGAGDNGMIIGNSGYTTVEFCSFTRNRDTGLQLGASAHHINVINCDSYENADLGAGTTTSGGNADGFAPKLDVGDSILFRGCRAWMNSDDGWDGYLRTPAGVPDNMTTFLEDCWAFRNGYYWLDGSTTSSQNGNGFKMGGSDNKDQAHNFVLIKCLGFHNKAKGFDQNSNAGSIYLYHCTAYNNGANDYGLNSSPVTYKPGAALVLKNNMSLGARGVAIPAAGTTIRSLVTATNSFSTASSSAEILSFDTAGITGMRSVEGSLPVLNFMRLNPAAPTPYTYLDKGTVVTDILYRGNMGIPFTGTAPDLGAFELSNSILPLKIASFSAFADKNGTTLEWRVVAEKNNKGWFIERSSTANSSSWVTVGFVGPANNGSSESYAFLDKNPVAGDYYYRLKQVGINEQITYSNVILVRIDNGKQDATMGIYPNPFKSAATIRYYLPVNAKVSLAVYNQQGQFMGTLLEEQQRAGTHQVLMNGKYLPKSNYYLKLVWGDKAISGSAIKE